MQEASTVGLEEAIVAVLGLGMQGLSDVPGTPLGVQLAAVPQLPPAVLEVHVTASAPPVARLNARAANKYRHCLGSAASGL